MVDHSRCRRRFEVTVLVEDIIGWQQAFAGNRGNLAPVAQRGGVEERASLAGGIGLDGADQRGDLADGRGDFSQRRLDIGHKVALEEQVARRIAETASSGKTTISAPAATSTR